MRDLTTPLYRARLADGARDLHSAQALRHLAFFGNPGFDADDLDHAMAHVLIESLTGQTLATFRIGLFGQDDDLSTSYCAQFYDLSGYLAQSGTKAEVGRLCLHPGGTDPAVLRLAFAALTRFALEGKVAHLFGATSFTGADVVRHQGALAWLAANGLGPVGLRPAPHDPRAIRLSLANPKPEGIPPLLRLYLGLGGWVADHAIADPALDTLHIFTALDLSRLPAHRIKALRRLAYPEAG